MAVHVSVPASCCAWLLDLGAGVRAAVGAHHIVEYLLDPQILTLPCAPAYCPGVLIWREQMIPLADLWQTLGRAPGEAPAWRHAVVLVWQPAPGTPLQHGALIVRATPAETWVTDDMACALPPEPTVFAKLGVSCFVHERKPVPVLNIARLYSSPLHTIR